jgi:hypothetical protein
MGKLIKKLKHSYKKSLCQNIKTGEIIKLNKIISEEDDTIVWEGILNDRNVIAKLCIDNKTSSELENKYYDFLSQYNMNLPKHYPDFYINKYNVLILDRLDNIKSDSGITIGKDILKQLQILHINGIMWGSCKPNNIMKNGSNYTIIDLGSISLVAEGACRKSFSSGYRTQDDTSKCVIIYPWNDLYELGKAIVAFEMKRNKKDFSRSKLDKYGYLNDYFKYLKNNVPKFEFTLNNQIYKDLYNLIKI